MRKSENYRDFIIGFILPIVCCLLALGLFAFSFFDSTSLYPEYDIDYSELMCEELTFSRYEKMSIRGSDPYAVYFEEFEKPFEISSITAKKLDRTSLESLTKGESIKVYYRETSSGEYDYEICEFGHGSATLLSLSDYIEANQNNQIAGIVFLPMLIIITFLLVYQIIISRHRRIKCDDNFESASRKKKTKYKAQGNMGHFSNFANGDHPAGKGENASNCENQESGIIALAYLHRYGWIAIVIVCAAVFSEALLLVFGIGSISFAIWTFVGYKCRWKHIFCSYQDLCKRKMTPDNIRWGWIEKFEAYYIPFVFLLMGVSACVAFLLFEI